MANDEINKQIAETFFNCPQLGKGPSATKTIYPDYYGDLDAAKILQAFLEDQGYQFEIIGQPKQKAGIHVVRIKWEDKMVRAEGESLAAAISLASLKIKRWSSEF